MDTDPNSIDGRALAAFAADCPEAWSAVEGALVEHATLGPGRVAAVRPRRGQMPMLDIEFFPSGAIKSFNPDSFTRGHFRAVRVPQDLMAALSRWTERRASEQEARSREEEKRKAREQAIRRATAEFDEIAERHGVPIGLFLDDNGITPLISILKKVDGDQVLDASEVKWLEQMSVFNVLGAYHYRRFERGGDTWDMVKACSNLRRAMQPAKALEISATALGAATTDPKALAALLTTRGGAYRDVLDLDQARKCATAAIDIAPGSFHPYNLLGAICYQEGSPNEGDVHFEQAARLGAPTRSEDTEIRAAFFRSEGEVRATIANHLLSKDPTRFAWVRSLRTHEA